MALDYEKFISEPKSFLIAPAGFGKTHSIAEGATHASGKQLILTHTNAGVASIKEKVRRAGIRGNDCHIETITSYAQKYVHAFYHGTDIPEQDNSRVYYPFIIRKATELVQLRPIIDVIEATYTGLFVDEYQDCTMTQHRFICALAAILPTRIVGDHLQGIFNFNDEQLVDLRSVTDMGDFLKNQHVLETPWRWQLVNQQLGESLKQIRACLEQSLPVDLNNHRQAIEVVVVNERELYIPGKSYYQQINKLLSEKSLLVIHPNSTSVEPRLKLVKLFGNRLTMLESIDDKDFYRLARIADNANETTAETIVKDLVTGVFSASTVDAWFNDKGLKRKQKTEDIQVSAPFVETIQQLKSTFTLVGLAKSLRQISQLPETKCFRLELFDSLCKAIEDASSKGITVYQSMVARRNNVRQVGRKIFGRCIGTTLLTKGLEFDTVAVINTHQFNCPKHLYVALSRACKRLLIFTNNTTLSPY